MAREIRNDTRERIALECEDTETGAEASRVCLITGAAGLLGSALCKTMHEQYLIAAVCKSKHPPVDSQKIRFVDPLRPEPVQIPRTYVIKADLSDPAQVERIVELTLARFGKVDVLINNAVHWSLGPMVETRGVVEESAKQFEVNTLAPMRLAVALARAFWRDRRSENIAENRNVINISSTSGINVYGDRGQSVYSASKAAMNMLSQHMAVEFKRFGVRVNAVAPTTFPSIVPTERVAEEVLRIDRGDMSGLVVKVES